MTYYAMLSAAGFGDDLAAAAGAAVQAGLARGHVHPRFGLVDAFNADISQAAKCAEPNILRCSGSWAHHVGFAIDEGPILLHLENARSGLFWRLMAANPNIRLPGSTTVQPTSLETGQSYSASATGVPSPNTEYALRIGSQEVTCRTGTPMGGAVVSSAGSTIPPTLRIVPLTITSGTRWICWVSTEDSSDHSTPTPVTIF